MQHPAETLQSDKEFLIKWPTAIYYNAHDLGILYKAMFAPKTNAMLILIITRHLYKPRSKSEALATELLDLQPPEWRIYEEGEGE